jgi:tripartite-type tricarboxylate transporter receptor subunit TctC
MNRRHTLRGAMLLLMAALIAPLSSYAQAASTSSVQAASTSSGHAYPTKPVRVVSPYPPGSSADIIGRIYAPKLAETLGRPFIVDNRAGASGNIAGELVARAAPDGYTLLLLNTPIATSPLLIKSVPFDAQRDFQPIGMLGLAPHILVVNNSLPVKNVKELVALAKSRPGKLAYASTGIGGGLHLAMELLKLKTGIDMLHVPYKGSGTTVPDMIGGRIDVMFGSAPALLPHVRSGRIHALGIASLKRSAAAPDLPTLAETGVPGFESVSFTSLAAPVATPRSVISLLNSTIEKSAQSPEVSSALANQGTDRALMTPEQVRAYIRDEIAKWSKVVTAAGVQAE